MITEAEISLLFTAIKEKLKNIKNDIWKARNLEKNIEQTERIKFYIQKRYDNFKDNTKK